MNVIRLVVVCVACNSILVGPVLCVLGDNEGAMKWEYASSPDEVSIAKIGAETFAFPGTLKFLGVRWRLVDRPPERLISAGGVQCRYESDDSKDDLLYFQGNANSESQWYVAIRPRQSGNSDERIRDKVLMIRGKKGEVLFVTLVDGMFDGVMERYYPNGVMKFAGMTRHGAIHGNARAYRPDGTLWWTGIFNNDKLDHSTVRVFGQNGNHEIKLSDEQIREVFSKWRKESTKNEGIAVEQFLKQLPQESKAISGRTD
ncbi:toxin-antitoxin system YwqK family antitoxin [Bremerella sp. P1]|uniref:toxin-antitoxin system YwqK family antitoxin n=1 Tax=Bremerella sp. P1 TaxID=3026424 RepID=UPI002368070D|nr:hypothetical protein [Bremerella sp. P1]WDI42662.1 hypothetical protein PSR63_01715 [Bremerella sp. P1]